MLETFQILTMRTVNEEKLITILFVIRLPKILVRSTEVGSQIDLDVDRIAICVPRAFNGLYESSTSVEEGDLLTLCTIVPSQT